MKIKDCFKATTLAAAFCLFAFPIWAQQSSSQQTGDPVADAARKARDEKKNAPKAKKVIKDDDVKPSVPEPKPASGGTDAAATGQKPGDANQAEDPNSEKAWRKRFSDQRAKIDKAEKELDVLQRELEKSQVQYYNDPQKALTEQNNRKEVNDKTTQIDAKKKEIDQLRQQLDDLETQLRKAGGDPGWAR